MDVFTHFAAPYLLLWLLGRPQRERLAGGIGGYAPDLDVLTGWIGLFGPEWEFFGHRGVSHSLVGAPLYALGAMALLALPPWARKWPRMAVWEFTPRLVLLAMAASLTHLGLDLLTVWGVPLLYPWALDRFSLNGYSYGVMPATLVSGYLAWRLVRGTATDRVVRNCGVTLVVVLLVAGAVRLGTRPDVEGAESVQPGTLEWQWRTYARTDEGWEVTWWSFGKPTQNRTYPVALPRDPGGQAALEAARATEDYRAHRLYAYGPEAIQVEPAGPGSWNVTFLDLLARAQADGSTFRFRGVIGDDHGALRMRVDEAGVRVLDDG